MNDTDSADLFLRQKFSVIESGCQVVNCINVGTCDGECLCLVGKTKIAFLVVVVNV